MARFFPVLLGLALVVAGGHSVRAIGVDDFVAVADSGTAAVYNPAGLTGIPQRNFLLEHRLGERDLALGWDDLAVYSARDQRGGCGALFFAYSQDKVGLNLYNRSQDFGYAYGWKALDSLAVGISAKINELGRYDNSSGVMVKQATLNDDFLIDMGLLFTPRENLKIGFAYHNLGSGESGQPEGSQATLGVAYRLGKLLAAAEVYDLLDEDTSVFEGSLWRTGLKYNLTAWFQIQGVYENSISDGNFTGKMLAFQFRKPPLNLNLSWYQAEGNYINDDTVQAEIGFTF